MAEVNHGLRAQVQELHRRYQTSCAVFAEYYSEKAIHYAFPSYVAPFRTLTAPVVGGALWPRLPWDKP